MSKVKKIRTVGAPTQQLVGMMAALGVGGPSKSGVKCRVCKADQPAQRPCGFCPGLPKDSK